MDLTTKIIKAEMAFWGLNLTEDSLTQVVKIVKDMRNASGWHIVKCCAFAARSLGVQVGDIGPVWKKPKKFVKKTQL